MWRLGACIVAVALSSVLAGPVRAEVRAVAQAPESAIAVNGRDVFWTTQTRSVIAVRAVGVDSGPSRLLLRNRLPRLLTIGGQELVASESRIGLRALFAGPRRRVTTRLFAGPNTGPLTRAPRSLAQVQQDLTVSGDLLGGSYGSKREIWTTVIDEPGRPPVRVQSPREAGPGRLAGNLIGWDQQDSSGRDVATLIVVRNWRTGALVHRVRVRDLEGDFDIAPDGRLVYADERGGLTLVGPMGSRRKLPRPRLPLSQPRFAGTAIAAVNGDGVGPDHVAVVSPDTGAVRRLGPDTLEIGAVAASQGSVAWLANDCVLAARLEAPTTTVVPKGPCARAEAHMPEQSQRFRSRVLRIRVQCVNEPTGSCRGELRVRAARGRPVIGRRAYDVPVGRRATVRVRLERAAARRLRRITRSLGRYNEITVDAEAVSVDSEGRASTAVSPFGLAR